MGVKKRRVYYQVLLETVSALGIGGADSTQTDVDVALDSLGYPVIPATSLAGALRAGLREGDRTRVFGSLDVGEGALRVFDATFVEGNRTVSIRDNVSLDRRVAVPGLKFDREIVERGAQFCALLEVVDADACPPGACKDELGVIEELFAAIHAGDIRLGAKKTRGMGRLEVRLCRRRNFDLSDPAERESWLDFDPFDASSWESGADDLTALVCAADSHASAAIITLALSQAGGVSVREYTTEPESYDYSQLAVHESQAERGSDDEIPVIPGTSWAGAFRDRYESFSSTEQGDRLFGTAEGDDAHRSRITFSESVLEHGAWKTYTRNAIDRFTGGTLDRALFTERSYFGGTTMLELRIEEPDQFAVSGLNQPTAPDLEPLIASLADLHNGFLSVGGLASVGHGLFRIAGVELHVFGEDRSKAFAEALLHESGKAKDMVEPDVSQAARLLAVRDMKAGDRG